MRITSLNIEIFTIFGKQNFKFWFEYNYWW